LKKGADRGIDGRLYFTDTPGAEPHLIVISVKGGERISSPHMRDLRGVVDREDAAMGVLLSMNEPTREMVREAASAAFYTSPWGRHPRLQILTVQQLLAGAMIDYPSPRQTNVTLKRSPRPVAPAPMPRELEFGLEPPASRVREKQLPIHLTMAKAELPTKRRRKKS
jgi:site-specific DNA-methyltransferase (adenine-specific)